jgi:hypothetical protein
MGNVAAMLLQYRWHGQSPVQSRADAAIKITDVITPSRRCDLDRLSFSNATIAYIAGSAGAGCTLCVDRGRASSQMSLSVPVRHRASTAAPLMREPRLG